MLPFLLVAAALLSLVGAQCPDGAYYDSSFQKCYEFVSIPTDFLTAETYCLSIGGHLVTVGSGFENSFLGGVAFGRGNPWIGYSYLQKSQWSWTSGSYSTFSNWASGQPADPSVYQCASLRSADNTWLKEMCSANRPYICDVSPNATVVPSCPSQAPATTSSTGGPAVCSLGYTMYTGSSGRSLCYKVDSVFRSWQDAITFCAQDGGVLPKIEDSATNTFLLLLAGVNTPAKDPWIGLVCPTYYTADCYWISDNTKLGSFQPWYSATGPMGVNGTCMLTWDAGMDGLWSATNGKYATFCQKDPVNMLQFVEEVRQKKRKEYGGFDKKY